MHWQNVCATGAVQYGAILALGLLLMGINKQLDLQTDFNAFGRTFLYSQGLYLLRQSVKNSLVIAMSLIGFFLLALAAWRTRYLAAVLAGTDRPAAAALVCDPACRCSIWRSGGWSNRRLRGSWLLEPLGVLVTGAAAWHEPPAIQKQTAGQIMNDECIVSPGHDHRAVP
jgi:hypothetical protein